MSADLQSCACITIIRKTLYPRDEALFQRVLEAGLRAVGEPIGDRRARLLDGSQGMFHALLDGTFDCHLYSDMAYLLAFDVDLSVSDSVLLDAIRESHAHIHVEVSPPNGHDAFKMVAAGVAELLDEECIALVDYFRRRVVRCSLDTSTLLRSADAAAAFAGGYQLVDRGAPRGDR